MKRYFPNYFLEHQFPREQSEVLTGGKYVHGQITKELLEEILGLNKVKQDSLPYRTHPKLY